MGKHSGSGQGRNYSLDAANQAFKAKTGRDLTQQEITWLNNRGDVGQVGHDVAASRYADGLAELSNRIVSYANSLGVPNIDINQANSIRDSIYRAGDPNIAANFDTLVQARLENTKQEQLTQQLQDKLSPKTAGDPEKSTVNQIFQDVLGRAATAREQDYFGSKLASGDHPYDIEQVLRQSPEALQADAAKQQAAQQTQFQSGLDQIRQNALASEEEAFRRAQPEIISAYMKAGRLGSSGLDAALANARSKIAAEREQFINNLSAQGLLAQQGFNQADFVANQSKAYQDQANRTALDLTNAGNKDQIGLNLSFNRPLDLFARTSGLLDQARARTNELQDYATQKNAFDSYLADNRSQASTQGWLQLLGQLGSASIKAAAL